MKENVFNFKISNRDWVNGNYNKFIENEYHLIFQCMLKKDIIVMRTNVNMNSLDECEENLSFFIFNKKNLISYIEFPETPNPMIDWNKLILELEDKENNKVINSNILENLFETINNSIIFIDERIGLYFDKKEHTYNIGYEKSMNLENIIKHAKILLDLYDLDPKPFFDGLENFKETVLNTLNENINFSNNFKNTISDSDYLENKKELLLANSKKDIEELLMNIGNKTIDYSS